MKSLLNFRVLTLFPEMFPGALGYSVIGRALEEGVWSLDAFNIRDAAEDRHKTVDDRPFGGGAGMVMKPDVVDKAVVQAAYQFENPLMIYMSPRGKPLTQKDIMRFVTARNLLILCGRFEGVDERVLQKRGFEEVSIGDFVLAGGEIPAMALIEACVRTLPGVLGDGESAEEDSFAPGGRLDGLLEYPQYTRPRIWEGAEVPEVLVSGNHAEVAKWRLEQAKELTSTRRPDLWKKYAELIDK